jgi:hypothetical protein
VKLFGVVTLRRLALEEGQVQAGLDQKEGASENVYPIPVMHVWLTQPHSYSLITMSLPRSVAVPPDLHTCADNGARWRTCTNAHRAWHLNKP